MVSLKELPGLSVSICAGKELRQLREYDGTIYRPRPSEVGGLTIAKYIISEPGNFVIKIDLQPSFHMNFDGIICEAVLNGVSVGRRLLRKSVFEERGSLATAIRGVETKTGAEAGIRPFQFADNLPTDVALNGFRDLKNEDLTSSGIIIRVFEIQNPRQAETTAFLPGLRQKAMNESLAKGEWKMSNVGYGHVENAAPLPVSSFKKTRDQPLAIIKFDYRAKEVLQFLRIIPNTTKTQPESVSRPELEPEPMEYEQNVTPRSRTVSPLSTQRHPIDLDSLSSLKKMHLLKDLIDSLSALEKMQLLKDLRKVMGLYKKPKTPDTTPVRADVNKIVKKTLPAARTIGVLQGNSQKDQGFVDLSQED